MKAKKIFSFLMIFNIVFMIVILSFNQSRAEASSVVNLYKMAEGVTKSVIKSLEARKGLKTLGKASLANDVTQAVSMGLQDYGKDVWDTINGQKFNATPLKDMPGWLKVTLGTGSVVTGTDIAFDIYDYINQGGFPSNTSSIEPVGTFKTIKPLKESIDEGLFYYPITDTFTTGEIIRSIGGWTVKAIYRPDIRKTDYYVYSPDGVVYSPKYDDGMFNFFTEHVYLYVSDTGRNASVFIYNLEPDYSGKVYTHFLSRGAGSALYGGGSITGVEPLQYKNIISQRGWQFSSSIGFDTGGGSYVVSVPVPTVEFYETEPIGTGVLIVPDPNFHDDIDLAIENNRDMVSNPESFLENNPQFDPDAEVPPVDECLEEEKLEDGSCPPKEENEKLKPEIDDDIFEMKKIDITPITEALKDIKGLFPFSLPWDFYNIISVFNLEPKTPVFEISSGETVTLGGFDIPINYDFDIDFSQFDSIALIFRWGLLIVFDIFLVLGLKRIVPD